MVTVLRQRSGPFPIKESTTNKYSCKIIKVGCYFGTNHFSKGTVLRQRPGPLSTAWSETKKSPRGVMFRVALVAEQSAVERDHGSKSSRAVVAGSHF